MSTIVEFNVSADRFPLGTIFTGFSEVTVELERVVPKADGVIPYFWVDGIDVSDIVAQFSNHPGVKNIEVVDSFETQYLMKCEWVQEHAGILAGLVESNIVLLTATGTEDGWEFEVRGDDADSMSRFKQYCDENGIRIEIAAVHAMVQTESKQKLTETQQEALLLAYERGYFDSPRNATLTEIADELGMSQQALGSRIQRGTRRLIANVSIDSK
ncbi:helix-turn-helix domain-containing protein [Haladaptatus sp. DFWS20]|uniref:helix-turn-helix domain-containing protein n=1 Tax=Haladaptatus sp. DFWS20 TaxID=3403467 RepID=UPI003EBEE355